MHRDELGQVMDDSGIKTGLNERKFTAHVFIQLHGAVQPHATIPRLTRAPLRHRLHASKIYD